MKKIFFKNQKGFTLIETLVAILILALAITGPMTIAARSIQSTAYARDMITATFLAQDALEFVIAKKNYNLSSGNTGNNWLSGISSGCVDTLAGLSSSISGSACPLYLSPEGFYRPGSGEATKFSRGVSVVELQVNGEARITATVTFSSGILSGDKTVEISTNIFNLNK